MGFFLPSLSHGGKQVCIALGRVYTMYTACMLVTHLPCQQLAACAPACTILYLEPTFSLHQKTSTVYCHFGMQPRSMFACNPSLVSWLSC